MIGIFDIEQNIEQLLGELRQRVGQSDLGWFAGIFDGEGTVVIHRAKRPKGGFYHCLYGIVGNSDPRMIQKCRDLASEILTWKKMCVYQKCTREGCADQFVWQVSGIHAATLLGVLRPFLVSKREQADLGVKFQQLIDTQKRLQKVVGRSGWRLSEEDVRKREEFAQQLHWLNGQGPLRSARMQIIAQES